MQLLLPVRPKITYSNADYLLRLSHYFSIIILLKLNESQSRTICHVQSEFLVSENILQNAQFTELLFLQNVLLIAIISTKMKFLFTRVDTGKGNAKTALLIPTLSDIPVCQIPALISECLSSALPSLTVTILTTNIIAEKQLVTIFS